jgi:heme exporter protein D
MDLGPHAFFIVAAYTATGLIVAGLIGRAVLDHRAQLRALSEFEGRGVRRRSGESPLAGETVDGPQPDIRRAPVEALGSRDIR